MVVVVVRLLGLITFTNINPTEVALYYVGAAGAGRKHDISIGNSGADGGGGFILVELEKL